MSMSLYEINQAILSLVDEETGEILDIEGLAALQMEREHKIENVACWVKNLVAEGAALRAEEVNLAERRKKIERKVERLKAYLEDALAGEKFESTRCTVNFRKTSRVEISDIHAAAEWADDNGLRDIVTYSAPTISKTEISKLLKEGREIPGCALVDGVSMSVK